MIGWTADAREFIERRGTLIRAALWMCFTGAIAYCSIAYLDTWNAQHANGNCYSSLGVTPAENAAWSIAIVAASLLFTFLTNRWLVVGLGMIGIPAFFFTALGLALGSCGSPQPANLGIYAYYVAFFGGSSLGVAAVIGVVVSLVRYLSRTGLAAPLRRLDERQAEPRTVNPLIHIGAVITAVVILIDILLEVFWGKVFVDPVVQVFVVGVVILIAIGIVKAVRGN
jgi:hypothetical protein